MTYLEEVMYNLVGDFPDVPLEALKAGVITGIDAFAHFKDGVSYVGTCGTKRKEAVAEIINFQPGTVAAEKKEIA